MNKLERISAEEIKDILGDVWDCRYIPKDEQRQKIRRALDAQLEADKAKIQPLIEQAKNEERKKIGEFIDSIWSEQGLSFVEIPRDIVEALKSGKEVK